MAKLTATRQVIRISGVAAIFAAGACANNQIEPTGPEAGSDSPTTGSSSGDSSGGGSGSDGSGPIDGGAVMDGRAPGDVGVGIDSGAAAETGVVADAASPDDGASIMASDTALPPPVVCPGKVVIPVNYPVFVNYDDGVSAYLTSSAFGPPYPLNGYTGPYAFSGGNPASDAATNYVLSLVSGQTVSSSTLAGEAGADAGVDGATDSGGHGGTDAAGADAHVDGATDSGGHRGADAAGADARVDGATDSGGDGGADAAGADAGNAGPADLALDLAVTQESGYGAGMGFYMSACADATAFRGISFWVRGQAPTGQFGMTLITADTVVSPSATIKRDAGSTASLPLTSTWTQFQIPWADFVGGVSSAGAAYTVNGDNINGMRFNMSSSYARNDAGGYSPVPKNLDFQIDDIEFIP